MDATGAGTGLIAALHATCPVGEHADKLMLFGSFTWRAETSYDGGATWEFDEQMLATRTDPT